MLFCQNNWSLVQSYHSEHKMIKTRLCLQSGLPLAALLAGTTLQVSGYSSPMLGSILHDQLTYHLVFLAFQYGSRNICYLYSTTNLIICYKLHQA